MKFYHGTTENNWKKIQEEGILWGKPGWNETWRNKEGEKIERTRYTYLTPDLYVAETQGSKEVILEVEYEPIGVGNKVNGKAIDNYAFGPSPGQVVKPGDHCWQFSVFIPIPIENVQVSKKVYILQTKEKGYAGCYLISLLNALIYYEKPYIISLEDDRWEDMVDKYKCRYGACIRKKEALYDLSLEAIRVEIKDIANNLPVAISSFTKVGFHSSLVIATNDAYWTILNYNGRKGNLVTYVNKKDIDFPSRGKENINNKHFHLKLKNSI